MLCIEFSYVIRTTCSTHKVVIIVHFLCIFISQSEDLKEWDKRSLNVEEWWWWWWWCWRGVQEDTVGQTDGFDKSLSIGWVSFNPCSFNLSGTTCFSQNTPPPKPHSYPIPHIPASPNPTHCPNKRAGLSCITIPEDCFSFRETMKPAVCFLTRQFVQSTSAFNSLHE